MIMDLFKFSNANLNLLNAEPINNYDSIMWIERYDKAGEFTLQAKLSSGIVGLLGLGSIISHTKTYEACIVESIEINESVDLDPTVTITGRSLVSYLEHRIVGENIILSPPTVPYTPYILSSNPIQVQIRTLINQHITTLSSNLTAQESDSDLVVDERIIERKDVYSAVLDLLSLNALGIRTVRKNSEGAIDFTSLTKTLYYIHSGRDLSDSIIFSWDYGELESASYLFSIKNYKNTAVVHGKFIETIVYDTPMPSEPYDKRVMIVDARDIDESLIYVPTGTELADIIAAMNARGAEALANQRILDISNVDISKTTSYSYRTDYDIGDIVSISGNYGIIEQRRVIEFVEIEDENGETGYPTLSVL
jgi:hypothetical protein